MTIRERNNFCTKTMAMKRIQKLRKRTQKNRKPQATSVVG